MFEWIFSPIFTFNNAYKFSTSCWQYDLSEETDDDGGVHDSSKLEGTLAGMGTTRNDPT